MVMAKIPFGENRAFEVRGLLIYCSDYGLRALDGAAVLLGVDGVSDFNGLHSRHHDDEVQLYAFDILALDGEDLRKMPLSMRKSNLARLLARRPERIFVAPFEIGEIGPDLFIATLRTGRACQ